MTHSGSTSDKRMVTVFHSFQSAMKQDRDSLTESGIRSCRNQNKIFRSHQSHQQNTFHLIMQSKILKAFLFASDELDPMDEYVEEFCKKSGIERSQLMIKSRRIEYVRMKRLFANYMCDTYNKIQIARYLNMNHSTVIHYLNTHSENLEYDKTYRDMWNKALS